MQHGDRLAEERRARLTAELMLEQVQAELSAANQKIAATNRELSDEIVVKREEVHQVRTVAETLRDENHEVKTSLERAESAIMIAERRLWDSLETIQDGFAVFDAGRVMVAANRAYLAAFDGLEMVSPGIHYHEMLRLMCEEGIVDLEDTNADDWLAMMAERWDAERIEPVTVKLWNGSFIKVIDRRTRDGDMVSLGLNITATIRREAELERARARAEAANRAKSAFLANMSHEIRTPMNGVIGMADMLSETGLDEEQRLFVETIRNSGEALLVIINDVLDYSKIEAKKLELHPARFDLERCIHEVLMLLQPSAHDKGLQLAVDYDMFMPTEFVGDPGRVRQILTNLAGNAVKFTAAGHVAIRVVGLPVRDGAAYRVHVTVEDTGIGIPEEKLRSIFGEFSQVEDERNRRYDGTGLGLAITKRLVEIMDGEMWVDSEVNVGSGFGFHITMPIAEGAATPPVSAPDWIERAIVVDEPQMTRAILTKQLAAMGLQTLSVRMGGDLDALAPTARDVIILGDIGIAQQLAPRLSGPGAPRAVALLSAPLAGVALPGVAAAIQKPAQRREIARVLGTLEPPSEPPVAQVTPAAPPVETTRPTECAALVPETSDVEAPISAAPVPEAPAAAAPFAEAPAPEMPVSAAAGAAGPVPELHSPETIAREAGVEAAAPALPGTGPDGPVAPTTAADLGNGPTVGVDLPPELVAGAPGGDGPGQPAPVVTAPDAAPSASSRAETPPAQAVASSVEAPPQAPSSAGAPLPRVEAGTPGQAPPPAPAPFTPPPAAPSDGTNTSFQAENTSLAPAATLTPTPATTPTPVPAAAPERLGPAMPVAAGPLQERPPAETSLPPEGLVAEAPTSAPDRFADGFAATPALAGAAEAGPAHHDIDAQRGETAARAATATPAAQPLPAPGLATAGDHAAHPAGASPNPSFAAPDPLRSALSTPAEAHGPASDSQAGRARQMRVLAAEDNKTNRLVFSKMVQSLDIDLVFAENGREAVTAFEERVPDLIFTDISMPEMDGKEASRRIRQIEAANALPRTPIVAITAHAMAGDAEEILAAGIDTYLTKPLKRSALVDAIRTAAPAGVRDPLAATSGMGAPAATGAERVALPEQEPGPGAIVGPRAHAVANYVAE